MARKKKKTTKQKKKWHYALYALEILLLLILIPSAFCIYKISQIETYHMDQNKIEENEFSDSNIGN